MSLIKYKGNTGKMLAELSVELGFSVDLRAAEVVLKGFFMNILETLPAEKRISLVCSLPPSLKQFCQPQKSDALLIHARLQPQNIQKTRKTVLEILGKHLQGSIPEELLVSHPEYEKVSIFPNGKENLAA